MRGTLDGCCARAATGNRAAAIAPALNLLLLTMPVPFKMDWGAVTRYTLLLTILVFRYGNVT